jgi:RNAse (barnase) inhibitor barstar
MPENIEERLDALYNDIIEDYKWYKAGNQDVDVDLDELFNSIIRNIILLIKEIRRRNETLDNYPRLIEILKELLKVYY